MSCRLLAALATIGAVSAGKAPAPAPYVDTIETPIFDMCVVVVTKISNLIDKIPIASSLQKFVIVVEQWVEKYVIVDDIADAINITKTAAAVLLTIVTLLTVLNGLALLVNAVKDYLEGFLSFPTKIPFTNYAMPLEKHINGALNRFKAWDLREIVPLTKEHQGVKPTMAGLTSQLLDAITLAIGMATACNCISLVTDESPTKEEIIVLGLQIGICLAIKKWGTIA